VVEDVAFLIFYFLIGTVFCLSLYVIVRNLKRTFTQKDKLMPLHIWTISVSYNLMVLSFVFDEHALSWLFFTRFFAVVIGAYALWVLTQFQRRR
jgi:hypothetical protein